MLYLPCSVFLVSVGLMCQCSWISELRTSLLFGKLLVCYLQARLLMLNDISCVKVWLPAVKAKGLEISGTFSHRQGHIYMEMNFTNKALQHMTDFAIQFNKNR